jgi:hypothetical protein
VRAIILVALALTLGTCTVNKYGIDWGTQAFYPHHRQAP